MRCKACNRPFTEYENVSKNKNTGDYEDLCTTCRGSCGLTYEPTGEIPISDQMIEVPLLDSLPGFKG